MNEIQISNLKRIDEITSEISKIDTQNVVGAIQLATKIDEMRTALQNPEIIRPLRSLLGSNMGIGVDTDYKTKMPAQYPDSTIADCVLTALSQGYRLASPAGQEWMIFRGNFFAKKVGKFRKIIEFPGLTNFVHLIDQPAIKGDAATVKCYAKWKLNGEQKSIGYEGDECVFRMRQNSMSNDDNNTGKAESKLFTRILFRLTGSYVADIDDAEAMAATDVTPKKESEPDKKPDFMKESDLKQPEPENQAVQGEVDADKLPVTAEEENPFGVDEVTQAEDQTVQPKISVADRYRALKKYPQEARDYVKVKMALTFEMMESEEAQSNWIDEALVHILEFQQRQKK